MMVIIRDDKIVVEIHDKGSFCKVVAYNTVDPTINFQREFDWNQMNYFGTMRADAVSILNGIRSQLENPHPQPA